MMGTWFLATAYSEFMAAQIAKLAALDVSKLDASKEEQLINITETLVNYTQLFSTLFWIGCGAGILLLIVSPYLKKHMHGVQ